MSPSNQNNKFQYDSDFDSNIVVVLGALLCALILVLGFNIIARCFKRCRQTVSQETPGTLTSRGLKKRDLSQIPETVYGFGENTPATATATATECPICLGEFENGDRMRVLPKCNHGFHVKCIDIWLVSHSSCPICRHSILEIEQQPAGDGLPENETRRRNEVVVVVV